jgi:hypothetical protein
MQKVLMNTMYYTYGPENEPRSGWGWWWSLYIQIGVLRTET